MVTSGETLLHLSVRLMSALGRTVRDSGVFLVRGNI